MELRTIVAATPALTKLSASSLSLPVAYALRKCINVLQKETAFFADERSKILKTYGNVDGRGNVTFTGDNEALAHTAITELLDMEVSPSFEKVVLPISETVQLSVNDIELLTPFIIFKEVT